MYMYIYGIFILLSLFYSDVLPFCVVMSVELWSITIDSLIKLQ